MPGELRQVRREILIMALDDSGVVSTKTKVIYGSLVALCIGGFILALLFWPPSPMATKGTIMQFDKVNFTVQDQAEREDLERYCLGENAGFSIQNLTVSESDGSLVQKQFIQCYFWVNAEGYIFK
jgi:hypothetical protein